MRVIFGVFFALLIFASPARALEAGVEAGVNISTLTGPALSSGKFAGGVFLETGSGLLLFQPELLITNKSGADFFIVPLLLKLKFDVPVIKPFLVAGPDVGFKLSGTGVKTLDLAADVGGGVELSIGPAMSLVATVRYSLGLLNVIDSTTAPSQQTRSFYVLGGLAFGL